MHLELTVTAGPAQGQHFVLDAPDCFLFGRVVDAHLALPHDPYISRQHFLIELTAEACTLTDLQSKNGVFVNGLLYGGPIRAPAAIKQAPPGVRVVTLKDGDELAVGYTRIKVAIQASREQATAASSQWSIYCMFCGKPLTNPAEMWKRVSPTQVVCPACEKHLVWGGKRLPQNLLDDPPSASTPAKAPKTRFPAIKGYRFERVCAQTANGRKIVYAAWQLDSGRPVTITTFPDQTSVSRHALHLLRQKFYRLRQLQHPNIREVLDYGKIHDLIYVVEEDVAGLTLTEWLRSRKDGLPLPEAVPIWLELLAGLTYAHQQTAANPLGIVHHNLTPDAILLVRNGTGWTPKIADFQGIVSLVFDGVAGMPLSDRMPGRPAYWPREHVTHFRASYPATDVFSLAAIFCEMLGGPWLRPNFAELFARCTQAHRLPTLAEYWQVIATQPPRPVPELVPNLPAPVSKVLTQALQEYELPGHSPYLPDMLSLLRYADAGAFRRALEAALKEVGLITPLPSNPPTAPVLTDESLAARASEGTILVSSVAPSVKLDVALLVLDIVQSTQYLLNLGDTHFSSVIGAILRRAKTHPSAPELLFLRCTGDGFLAAFSSAAAAFELGCSFLTTPIAPDLRLRLALHWGTITSGPGGDLLGTEVYRVCQIQGLQAQDRIVPGARQESLPAENRILTTEQGLQHLPPQAQASFRPAGTFRLKHTDSTCALWVDALNLPPMPA